MQKVSVVSTNDIRYNNEGHIYKMVEESFILLELDKEKFGTDEWNPLGTYIKPGNNVVIKPNLVLHKNYLKGHEGDVECVYTQPSVVKPIIDYVIKAQHGEGKIVVGDAPIQECDFDKLINESGYKKLIDGYKEKGYNIELKDFRGVVSVSDYGVLHQQIRKEAEFCIVNVGEKSEFSDVPEESIKKIRITNYNPDELVKHHNEGVHEYCLAKDILDADVIINVPKPKTHRKAGLTACLKNLVGINCRKEYLPHHTLGSNSENGDEYKEGSSFKKLRAKNHDLFCYSVYQEKYFKARFFQLIVILQDFIINKFYKDKTSYGSWSGNNTISRTIVDLNKILLYADKQGVMRSTRQRKVFNVADMVISGEKNGPMAPSSKNVGLILSGDNSYLVDLTIANLMGMKTDLVPTLNCLKNANKKMCIFDDSEVIIKSNDEKYNNKCPSDLFGYFCFVPPEGWENVFNK